MRVNLGFIRSPKFLFGKHYPIPLCIVPFSLYGDCHCYYLRYEAEETSSAPASNSITTFQQRQAGTLISLFIIPFTNYIALFITTFFHQRMTQLHVPTRQPKNIILKKTEIQSCKIMRGVYKERRKLQLCTKFTNIQCKQLL